MERLRFTLSLFALVAAACLASSCGAHQDPGQSQSQDPLQSITLTPAVADAQNYPSGEVPFVGTGYYTNPPRMVTPLSAFWGTCYQNR